MMVRPVVAALLLGSLPVSAQVEESQDDLSSTALRPQPGGPATVGDPMRVTRYCQELWIAG